MGHRRCSSIGWTGQLLVRGSARMLLDRRGVGVDQMIAQVRAGVENYPILQSLAGPNSNTFLPTSPNWDPPPLKCSRQGFPAGRRLVRRGTPRIRFQVSLYGLGDILLAVREGLDVNPSQFWSRPGRAGIEGASARQARDRGSMERHSPLFPVAEPGSSARSPSRWRTRRRDASRCIRARHRERRSDAAGR